MGTFAEQDGGQTVSGHTFVFLGGLHRSGTSVLFKCLREHPDFSGFHTTGAPEDEGMFLQTVYPPAYVYGGPGVFGFSAEMHQDETHPDCTREHASKLFREWSPYWDLSCQYLLEKSPPNLTKAPFLQGLFPHSAFIMLSRHPVAVALATRKWSLSSLQSLIEHWLVCYESYRRTESGLRKKMFLSYEEFVAEPGKNLAAIYACLGTKAVDSTLDIRTDINEKYFSRWRALRKSFRERRNIQRIEESYEERVQAFGYSLKDL